MLATCYHRTLLFHKIVLVGGLTYPQFHFAIDWSRTFHGSVRHYQRQMKPEQQQAFAMVLWAPFIYHNWQARAYCSEAPSMYPCLPMVISGRRALYHHEGLALFEFYLTQRVRQTSQCLVYKWYSYWVSLEALARKKIFKNKLPNKGSASSGSTKALWQISIQINFIGSACHDS